MNTQLSEIWARALQLIRAELSELSFNTWIKCIDPISINNNTNTIILSVPEDFIRGIIESRHSSLIKNAIKQVTFKEYNLEFITPNDTNNRSLEHSSEAADENYSVILNPKYTFDTFVTGNSNRFAHAAALAVAEAPAKAYNPLFIYGGVGLGKTHLMHAIGHYVLGQNSSLKVLYVSTEKFMNEMINAIRDDKNEEFRNRYRNIDVLLIDDIQFIGGRVATQEEFFHTFNSLYDANKQIIISSDRPPKEINTLEERLRSRFEWGLIADIQPPDFETRVAILRKKAQLENLEIPNEIITFIADKIASNIRELEGALNRVIAYASLTKNSELTVELATEALKDILSSNRNRVITPSLIQSEVAKYFGLKPEDLKMKKRTKEIAYPRQIAMYLCRNMIDLSLPKIGEEFGGKDHTTVMHAINKISKDIKTDMELSKTIETIKKNIEG